MRKVRKISGDYIAGFVDGEGCFSLSYRKDKGKYFYWKASFVVVLRKDDHEILNEIREYFGIGNVTFSRREVRYSVNDTGSLAQIVIPFFDKHNLIGKKKYDFLLWKEAVEIINKNKKKKINSEQGVKGFVVNKWNEDNLERLHDIRNAMLSIKGAGKNRTFKHEGRK